MMHTLRHYTNIGSNIRDHTPGSKGLVLHIELTKIEVLDIITLLVVMTTTHNTMP
jgi:hypothetical protein